jgi:hypothetical protein
MFVADGKTMLHRRAVINMTPAYCIALSTPGRVNQGNDQHTSILVTDRPPDTHCAAIEGSAATLISP